MLRMSKLADYGTVMMTFMARRPTALHSAADLAERIGVTPATASKVLKMLAREGLVVALRGAKGGYRLQRPAAEISLAQVLRAMEGPIGLTECSTLSGLCSQESGCTVRANWQRINGIVLDALEAVSLEQMTRPISSPINVSALQRPGAAIVA
jgi:FeS assembly SUF system regulator